jgi:uncharacterized phage-associated protein
MSYLATAVANELLDRSAQSGQKLTQINIQKLVYFAHGWHLALRKCPLIQEPIEAWQYGPVVKRLYQQFRRFGSEPITEKAMEYQVNTRGELIASTPSICSSDPSEDEYAKSLVGAIWTNYGGLPPFRLVEITHLAGSPWANAIAQNRSTIPNDEIQKYFESQHSQREEIV